MSASTHEAGILIISTYPPRKCGIASFTHDLVDAIKPLSTDNFSLYVCALDKRPDSLYKQPVTMVMNSYDLQSCIDKAEAINRNLAIKLVCIEHEFGLYGGELGDYILGFLALVEKPIIVRFHTVLPAPALGRLKLVQNICSLADKVIVMTNNAARLLQDDYKVQTNKVVIIPHGTHEVSQIAPMELKKKYKLENKLVLTSFGLLSPNKGIEKGILAMKAISERFPNSIYLVLGQTHPNLLEQEGEKYRTYLQELIIEHNLQNHVRLVNEFVPTFMLMEFLALTDIYLFTSKDPFQAVSGTFLYAMSAGCPIITNSFVLADEMLVDDTGIILKTAEVSEMAEQAIMLLENDTLRKQMGGHAYRKTRNTTWKKLGRKHVELFYQLIGKPVYVLHSVTSLSTNS